MLCLVVVEIGMARNLLRKDQRVPSVRVVPDGAKTDCVIVRCNCSLLIFLSLVLVLSAFFLNQRRHCGHGIYKRCDSFLFKSVVTTRNCTLSITIVTL